MGKLSKGMEAFSKIINGDAKKADSFIRSIIGDSAGVRGATDLVSDTRYHFQKALEAGGRSKDFISEMGSLGQYGYSAEDGKKLLDAARSWKPMGKPGESVMHGEVGASSAIKDSGSIFYGSANGSVAVGETGLKQMNREERIARAHARHANAGSPEVLYAGADGTAAMTEEQMIKAGRGIETRGYRGEHEDINDASAKKAISRNAKKVEKHLQQEKNRARRASEADSARLRNDPASNVEHGKLSDSEKKAVVETFGGERDAVTKSIERNERKNKKIQESRDRKALREREEQKYKANETKEATSNWLPENGNTNFQSAERDWDAKHYADELRLEEFNRTGGTKTYSSETTGLGNIYSSKNLQEAQAMGQYKGYNGGAGGEAPPKSTESASKSGTGEKAAEEVKAQAESTTPTSASENKPPESDFGGGAGDDMDSFFKGKLEANGISNADKYHVNRIQDEYRNYQAQIKNAGEDADKIAEINKSYGINDGASASEHFKGRANEDASTMDWIMGNNVPHYAAGTALLGGAVASCFSNKGKMSNSELYGQNF